MKQGSSLLETINSGISACKVKPDTIVLNNTSYMQLKIEYFGDVVDAIEEELGLYEGMLLVVKNTKKDFTLMLGKKVIE